MHFKGSMVAIVTPMNTDGSLDKNALENLIEWHIEQGTEAIIAVGTTGESPTLNKQEQAEVISLVVKRVNKRIPVIAGAGTNSTQSTLEHSLQAKHAGADALLLVTPYYNKPTQQGLYEHFSYIADRVDMPIILYNVPGRTACDLLPETVLKLSKHKNIIGIKEATGNIDRAKEIIALCDKNFEVYSGDDATGCELMLNGAKGVISVTSNIAPKAMRDMCDAALLNDKTLAEKINQQLMPLHQNLFLQSNPIPAKWALHVLNKIQTGIRLPLLSLDTEHHAKIKTAMQQAGVL